MKKIKVIALAEFSAFLQTKAILVMLLLLPLLMGASVLLQKLSNGQLNTEPRRFAVIDHTGQLYAPLAQQAELRNELLKNLPEDSDIKGPPFLIEEAKPSDGANLDALHLSLSERVRKEDLFAFVELPQEMLDGKGSFSFHSLRTTDTDLLRWLEQTTNSQLRVLRYQKLGLAAPDIQALEFRVRATSLDLFEQAPDGTVTAAKEVNEIAVFVAPMIFSFLMFMVIMINSPQLLNAVIEEKVSRVSEVLLGSVRPFDLMMGKLLGATMIALLITALYFAGGIGVAAYLGLLDYVPLHLLPYFVLFLVLGVFLFGSLCLAVGSACSEFKDAQSMITPVMLVATIPFMAWTVVLRNPDSLFSTLLSLLPTATPFLMLLRLALYPSPPLWQILLSIALTTGTTLACVWAAGRIFRVGLLLQGKTASFRDMLRWIF